jgi:D-glycero-D-manno-heptose 1,7-bisphosphate phosphatase
MAAPTPAFAVHLGADATPVPAERVVPLLPHLAQAGLDGRAIAAPEDAALQLQLPEAAGWDALNLAGLLAAARARPGSLVELSSIHRTNSPVRAVFGPPRLLHEPATWRMGVPLTRPLGTALLDRDGTINFDRHYLGDPDGVDLLPGAAAGLRLLAAAGVRLVVVTNQSGIGLGRITASQVTAVNARLVSLLEGEGITLSGIYICPHHPEAGCACRKPADGLARQAAAELGLDLRRAIVAGDKDSDLGLGRALGIPAFLMVTGEGARTLVSGGPPADYLVDDLAELARICTHPAGAGLVRPLAAEGAPSDA